MNMRNQTILITGATSGIGYELVHQLAARGNELVVIGRSEHKLSRLKQEVGSVKTYLCDLSQRHQVEEVMDQIVCAHPDISVLINNAAVQFTPMFTAEDFDHSSIAYEVTTNLTAPLWMISLLLSSVLLKQKQALIVNMSSGLAYFPKKQSAVYCATKAALHSISQSLRYQLSDTSVNVLEVLLPLVDTPMTEGRGERKLKSNQVAQDIIKRMEAGQDEIFLGKARFLPFLIRLAPGIARNIMRRS